MDYINIARQFDTEGDILSCEAFGGGLINNTFLVTSACKKYILQAINTDIFPDPSRLMANIVMVTDHLKARIAARGGDVTRETLTPVKAKNGTFLYKNWRMYLFIEDCVCLERAENAEQFYETGVSFGFFQRQLEDFPARRLYEVIDGFHDTPQRFAKLEQAVEKDNARRIAESENEISFLLERKNGASVIMDCLKNGEIPLRVTHNDTKLNNIMLDKDTLKGVCVIDLDTVMPGSALFDYGDAVRSGANPAVEDEPDTDKIFCDEELFEAFTRGFIHGAGGSLTQKEKALMVRSVWTIALEQAVRFLTDYLENDTYYKIKYEKHNLDRAKNQIALVRDIERKWDKLETIVRGI